MDYDGLLNGIDQARSLLVAAVDRGDPAATVPTCPDFTLDDLAVHVGEFCAFWTHALHEAAGEDKPAFSTDPGGQSRAGWLDEWTGRLAQALRATTGDAPCWTWHGPDQTAGFVASRSCHELTVHRVDAQLGAGVDVGPVPGAIGAAGIEELWLLVGAGIRPRSAGQGQTLHLHGTDHEPAEWLVRLAPEGPTVTREHAKGDLALRGAVGDLELLLYQRPPVGEVERFGDEDVLAAFHRAFTF